MPITPTRPPAPRQHTDFSRRNRALGKMPLRLPPGLRLILQVVPPIGGGSSMLFGLEARGS